MKSNFLLSLIVHLAIVAGIVIYGQLIPAAQIEPAKYNITLVSANSNNSNAMPKLTEPKKTTQNEKASAATKAPQLAVAQTKTIKTKDTKVTQNKSSSPSVASAKQNLAKNNSNSTQLALLQAEPNNTKQADPLQPGAQTQNESVIKNAVGQEKLVLKTEDSTQQSNFSADIEKYIANLAKDPVLYLENDISNLGISAGELEILRGHLASCTYRVNIVLDEDILVILRMQMSEDASVVSTELVSYTTNSKAKQSDIDKVISDVLEVFKLGACNTLPLPLDKFNSWSGFIFKLNIKSFFN